MGGCHRDVFEFPYRSGKCPALEMISVDDGESTENTHKVVDTLFAGEVKISD